MRIYRQFCAATSIRSWAQAGVLTASLLGMTCVATAMTKSATVSVATTNFNADAGGGSGGSNRNEVVIEAIKPANPEEASERKEMPWLGLSAEEASEALAAQLNLRPGVGLVATYIAPDGPAAKAGLQKNDVLVEFDGQALVVPAQLRKLVQVHKTGDPVQLAYYRAGKQQTATVTLGKTAETGWLNDEHLFQGNLRDLQKQLQDLPIRDAIREQMKVLRDSMGNIRIDQRKVQEEVRRSMEKAQKAFQEAMRNLTNNVDANMGPVRQALEELAKSGVTVDNHATVTVRNESNTTKSLVNADPSGTIVLVRNPKLHLTAHDKEGHLLFDGEIETAEQRAKVPRDLWQRVEPLLDKMESGPEAKPAEKPEAEE